MAQRSYNLDLMNDFNGNRSDDNRGGRRFGGGGRGFGGRRDYGGRGDRMMHKAVCANCGKECEVPFRPSGERPVYCSDCFDKMRNEGGNERRDNRNFDRPPRFDERCGPPPPPPPGGPPMHQVMDQLRNLNNKMDRLLNFFEPKTMQPTMPKAKREEPKPLETSIIDSIVAGPEKDEPKLEEPPVAKPKKTRVAKKKPAEKPQE